MRVNKITEIGLYFDHYDATYLHVKIINNKLKGVWIFKENNYQYDLDINYIPVNDETMDYEVTKATYLDELLYL